MHCAQTGVNFADSAACELGEVSLMFRASEKYAPGNRELVFHDSATS
jgi:hypothetical protein